MADVIFYEAFEEEAAALKRFMPPEITALFTWKTIQETGDDAPPATLISTRTQSLIPPSWAPALAGILTRSTGYDHLSRYREHAGAALRMGHLPLYCNRAVAEHAMMLWMALLRRLPRQIQQFDSFERDGLTGRECRDKTLLVVGVGNIGHEIVDIGRGLHMRALGVDPVQRWDDVDYVGFAEGAAAADVVVAAMNLTPANQGFFDPERLAQLKPGAIFINVARGELASATGLLRQLEQGALGGVGLDVYDAEPQLAVALRGGDIAANAATIMALHARPDVICTPHNAFNTNESVERKAAQSVEQLLHLRRTGTFLWPVP